MDKDKNKSQLAKDLANALFTCRLRDDLSELVDDSVFRESVTREHYKAVNECYIKATVLLVCAIADSKNIKDATGLQQ